MSNPAPINDTPSDTDLATVATQLDYFRNKAIELDEIVFSLRALLQSGKGFSELMNIEELLEAFMAVCRERCGAESSAVLLRDDLDPDQVHYRVRAFHNLDGGYVAGDGVEEELYLFTFPEDRGLLWQLIRQGDVFSVEDMRGMPRFKVAWQKWNLSVLKSEVWCPLIMGDQVLGVLTLGQPSDGRIPESDFTFLSEIASVASTNIDSTLKYEKNSRILKNIRTLYDINQQLANVNDFKRLTIETLSTAVDAMDAQKANLMLLNADSGRLEIKVVWGNLPVATRDAINEGRFETRSFAIGEGVAGMAAQSRTPVRINHRSKIEQVGKNTVHCILSVPLVYGGEVMGVMTMTNKVVESDGKMILDPLGRFTDDDAQLALGLADQAAVNLHKARLYDSSITDRLTGLKNARHFEEQLAHALDTVGGDGPLTLAITDIDHFKRFNDTYGHKAGDHVLAETARLLKLACRSGSTDEAFRYGGEEFCMLLRGTDDDTTAVVLDRWRQTVEDTEFVYDGQTMRVQVSVGICQLPAGGASGKDLFEWADHALYSAKESGRNQVRTFRDGVCTQYRVEAAGPEEGPEKTPEAVIQASTDTKHADPPALH